MAVMGAEDACRVDPGIMLGLTWEGLAKLLAAKAVADRICASRYTHMPSHGPSGFHLQVMESDREKQKRVRAELEKSGWKVLYPSDHFVVYELKTS